MAQIVLFVITAVLAAAAHLLVWGVIFAGVAVTIFSLTRLFPARPAGPRLGNRHGRSAQAAATAGRRAAPGKLQRPSSVLLHGTTFFISQLPKPACSYHVMTLNAIASQGPPWSGTTKLTFGTCAAGKLVTITRGSGSWGPGLGN